MFYNLYREKYTQSRRYNSYDNGVSENKKTNKKEKLNKLKENQGLLTTMYCETIGVGFVHFCGLIE